jgi:hypothetical protein
MRKFSGNRKSPDPITSDRQKTGQTGGAKTGGRENDPGRNALSIQPYRTEYRTIFK